MAAIIAKNELQNTDRVRPRGFPSSDSLLGLTRSSNSKELNQFRSERKSANELEVAASLIKQLTQPDRPPLNSLDRQTEQLVYSLAKVIGVNPLDLHCAFSPGKVEVKVLGTPIKMEFTTNSENVKVFSENRVKAEIPFKKLPDHFGPVLTLAQSSMLDANDVILGRAEDGRYSIAISPQGSLNAHQYLLVRVQQGKIASVDGAFGAICVAGGTAICLSDRDLVIDEPFR